MSIFKSCDIRGIYGDELTPIFAFDFGRAVGTALDGQRVVVGGDARPSTPRLKGALIEGLLATGCTVFDVGLVPTSALYFARDWLRVEGAVMVTASHNPPGYNGFKLQLDEWPITEAKLAALREQMARGSFRRGQGHWNRADIIEAYQAHIEQFFDNGPDLRVVVDAGNGCFSRVAPTTLQRKGVTVIERFCEIDGRFPNRDPNPAIAAHLTGLAKQVIAEKANLGVAYDGDGDRVVFVDEQGRVIPGDRAFALFIRHRLPVAKSKAERTVIYDIKSSSVVKDEIERRHGIPRMERSGHAFIKTTLMKTQAGLAGEISGHYFFSELQRDDALFATLLMLQILSQSTQPLSGLVDDLPHYAITPDLRLPCSAEDSANILTNLKNSFSNHKISTIDGVRIEFETGWALARTSVTEPLITLRFEGKTEAQVNAIQAEVSRRVPALGRLLNKNSD